MISAVKWFSHIPGDVFFEKCLGLVQAFMSVSLGFNRRCMPKSLSYNSFEYLNGNEHNLKMVNQWLSLKI